MLRIGVGTSTHRDPLQAARTAASAALKQAGVASCDFVTLFATVGYDQHALVRAVRDATGRAPLSGCSAQGIISQRLRSESPHAVAVMVWKSDELGFRRACATQVGAAPRAAGEAIARSLGSLPEDARALLLFGDGLSFEFAGFRTGLEAALPGAARVPMLGGMAADNWRLARTYQYHDDDVLSDAVTATLLSGSAPELTFAVDHGCVPIGLAHEITRCDGRVVHELDGRPALDVLGDFLGAEELADAAAPIVSICLGFAGDGGLSPGFVRGRAGAHGLCIDRSVVCGTTVWLARRDAARTLDSIDVLGRQLLAGLAGRPARAVLQFDSAGRGKRLLSEEERGQLSTRLMDMVGRDVPWIGLHGYGEIAPRALQNQAHQYSAAIAVLH